MGSSSVRWRLFCGGTQTRRGPLRGSESLEPVSVRRVRHAGQRVVIENTERLRHKIDSGRTGDKVAGSDPTVAGLGTDDEAAGKPPRPHEIASTRHRESVRPHETHDHPGLGHAWILVAFTLLLAIAIIVWTAAVHSSQRQVHAGSAAVITSVPIS